MSTDLLELELRFLIAKYGFEKVLAALAGSRGVDINELQSEVEGLENKKRRPKGKKKHLPTAMQSVSRMRLEDTAKYEALKVLAIRFDNKSFAASLREVRLLIKKLGLNASPKSRQSAVKSLFRGLTSLSTQELVNLAETPKPSGSSWFSEFTSQIVGGERRREE